MFKNTSDIMVKYTLYVLLYDKNDKEFDELFTATAKFSDYAYSKGLVASLHESDPDYLFYKPALDKTMIQDNLTLDADRLFEHILIVSCINKLSRFYANVDDYRNLLEKRKINKENVSLMMKETFTEYVKMLNKYENPDQQHVIDPSAINSDTNINDLYYGDNMADENAYRVFDVFKDNDKIKLTKENIILIEKDGDNGCRTGILRLDKALCRRLTDIPVGMSPRQFMKSLVSLAGSTDNLWNSKFMFKYAIHI